MSIPLTINGAVFEYPVNFDENWGVDATGWAQAVTNGMLQMAGGSFPITADINFGPNFGLLSKYFETRSAFPATTGTVRLSSADAGIAWRNNANSGNLILTTNTSDQLLFNGVVVNALSTPISIANGGTNSGTALNNNRIIVSTAGAIVEAAAITGNRAVKSNSSGIPVNATLTDSQLENTVYLYSYRRPVLQWSSATQINLETGITGTSGQAAILFVDGNYRTDSNTAHINFLITQNAALSGSAQSGLRTSLTATANTWYALYAVKVSDSATDFVVVGDTLMPIQANYATLNSNFGASSWVYLGTVAYGDGGSSTTSLVKFSMTGGRISVRNSLSSAQTTRGIRLATTAGATSITWTYASGTSIGSGQIPPQFSIGDLAVDTGGSSVLINFLDSGAIIYNDVVIGTASNQQAMSTWNYPLLEGLHANFSASIPAGIALRSYMDGILMGSAVSQL